MEVSLLKVKETIGNLPSSSKHYGYGTAGFRDQYTEAMHNVFLKVGVIAAVRSLSMNGKAIGVMITASHNPKEDNGVKIVDPDGGMLTQTWEKAAEEMVNSSPSDFVSKLAAFIEEKSIKSLDVPLVVIGADCRESSPVLSDYVRQGVELICQGVCLSIGQATTPLLHYCVANLNNDSTFNIENFNKEKYVKMYFDDLFHGFSEMVHTVQNDENHHHKQEKLPLILDCAYGVGSVTTEQFLSYCQEQKGGLPHWEVTIRNKVGEGEVNENSGAEHCQKLQIPCHGVDAVNDHHKLLCSFDGDADRIVFHAFADSDSKSWILLDGDRIACLIAKFLSTEMNFAGLLDNHHGLNVGVVQTAYANGSSTHFLREHDVHIHMTKTGVKFLHHKAQELDVGIYFEANGHGTVLFSDKFIQVLDSEMKSMHLFLDQPRRILALRRLDASLRVVNPTVGDALSDMLFALGILTVREAFSFSSYLTRLFLILRYWVWITPNGHISTLNSPQNR
jgi:phosphoacetylglucosamine mutase